MPDLEKFYSEIHDVSSTDFDDLAGYLAYRENAEHQKIVETFIQPIVGARGAVQYEI